MIGSKVTGTLLTKSAVYIHNFFKTFYFSHSQRSKVKLINSKKNLMEK